jgi:hypothetical protein
MEDGSPRMRPVWITVEEKLLLRVVVEPQVAAR